MNAKNNPFSCLDLQAPAGSQDAAVLHLSVLLIDGSGSMRAYGDLPHDVIDGLLAAEKRQPDAAERCVAVIRFGATADVLVPLMPASSAMPTAPYRAHGYTRLDATVLETLDALHRIVDERAVRGLSTTVSLSVITDGADSEGLNGRSHQDLVTAARGAARAGWELCLYGIGIDARAAAAALAFPLDPAHAITLRPAPVIVRRALLGMFAAQEAA